MWWDMSDKSVPRLVDRPNFSGSLLAVLTLPKVSRDDVAFVGVLARWLGATGALGRRTAALVGGPVRARAITSRLGDPDAARCELRIAGTSFELRGASAGVRRIAQRVLGGPTEIAAPRPLDAVEHAVWALVVAAALEDLGIAGEVWACEGPSPVGDDPHELAVELDAGGTPFTVAIRAPRSFAMRAPVSRVPAWAERVRVAAAIVVGRCLIEPEAIRRLAPRKIITLDRPASQAELVVLGGALGLVIRPSEVVAEVVTGYVVRAMSLPDDARVELTVGLGTTQLSLRQVFELAVGQIVPLGRPLAGPFEIRAQGSLVGRGELVDVEGELGVRIVSLGEQE
jgi:hypothetical protein